MKANTVVVHNVFMHSFYMWYVVMQRWVSLTNDDGPGLVQSVHSLQLRTGRPTALGGIRTWLSDESGCVNLQKVVNLLIDYSCHLGKKMAPRLINHYLKVYP